MIATEEKLSVNPAISVVIPVYNSAKYLEEAIDSILNQTFQDFEIICVYDKSLDNSFEILKKYSENDKRIKIVVNEDKKGIGYALNMGLLSSKGKYIARMDSDDIALPDRLKIQYEFMEKNSEVGICGSFIKKFGKISRVVKTPVTDEEIRTNLLFNCCILHPTVMMRKSVLDKHNLSYNSNCPICEDYDLWVNCAKYIKFYNIPKVLLKYREHGTNISKEKFVLAQSIALSLIKKQLEFYLEKEFDINEFDVLFNVENMEINNLYDLYSNLLLEIKCVDNINLKLFKYYLNKIVCKKLKKVFYKEGKLFTLLQMYKYNFKYALLFSIINFYKVKRLA